MLKYYLYIILTTFCSLELYAQGNGQANILVDSTTFLNADPINMQIIVNIPVGNTLTFPAIGNILEAEKLELLDIQETEIIKGDVNNTFKKIITFTAWEPGIYQIPEMTFSYKKNGQLIEVQSAALMLTVKGPPGVTGDSTYLAPNKTIFAEEPNFLDKLYYFFTHPVTVSILILLIAFLVFYGFITYKNRAKPAVPPTPEALARQQLEALKTDNPLANNDFQSYHTRISFILRTYFNGRFKISALEQPVSAFIPKLKEHKLMKTALFEECKIVLEHADLIKFAKASPLDIANKKAMDLSIQLLDAVQEKLDEIAAEKALAQKK